MSTELNKEVIQTLTLRNEDQTHWVISFRRVNNSILTGLHWNGRSSPSHVFECGKDEFLKKVKELCK